MSMQSESGAAAEYPVRVDERRGRILAVLVMIGVGAVLTFVPLFSRAIDARLAAGVVGVGTSLLAAGITSGFWMWLEGRPKQHVVVYKNCDAVPWSKLLSSASESLQISGVSLTKPLLAFVDDEGLLDLKGRGSLHVELLFCDPRSPFLVTRAEVESSSHDALVRDQWWTIVRSCLLAQMYEESELPLERVEIHLLNDALACTTFRSDSEIVVGPYLSCGPGTKTLRIRVSNSEKSHATTKALFEQLERDFDRVFRKGVRLVTMRMRRQRVVEFNWDLLETLGWIPPAFDTPPNAASLTNDNEERRNLAKARRYLQEKYGQLRTTEAST